VNEVIRIGPSIVMRAIRAVVWLPLLGFTAALLSRPVVRADLGAGWTAFGAVALSFTSVVVLVTTFRSDGVDLGPDGIVVRGFFKPARVGWWDVACVRVDRYRRLVVLERAGGRSVTLVYPGRGLLMVYERHFERELGRVVECWLARRGQHWLPVPTPPAHPLDPPTRPAR
jgi:hypothetical protein